MAKRPPSQSQADDTAAGAPAPTRARRSQRTSAEEAIPPGAPVPSNTPAERATAADQRPADIIPASEPSEHDIRTRAYMRYLERGGRHGSDFDDWLEAERDLKGRRG